MEQVEAATNTTRFVGLDVHRRYATVAAVDSKQQVVLTARRIDFEDFDVWIRKHLRPTDVVTLEATSNAWHLYDMLVPLVASVTASLVSTKSAASSALYQNSPRNKTPHCLDNVAPIGDRGAEG